MARPDAEASRYLPPETPDTIEQVNQAPLSTIAEPVVPAPEPMQNTPVRPVVSLAGPARTYTGRAYLMFDASLTREDLESVWDAVEEAAGSGVIVATRLVSQDVGVQVTLDLDRTTLDVAAFLHRRPGAEITPMAEDWLKVAWPAAL